jgi:hypothetical protein
MMSADTLRRLLEAVDVRRAPYAVAEACAGLLERDPPAAQAVRQYVRVLAALELGVAARRGLAALGAGDQATAGIAALLERVRAGVIPWSSRRRRFHANLRALEACGIPAAPILAAWEDPAARNVERYELHQAADGNFFVADLQAEGAGGESAPAPWKAWLGGAGGLQDFKGATAAIRPESFVGHVRGPLAFDGVGYGWLIPHVLQVSERSYLNYSAALYVAEPDLPALCMVLHMHDWQAWMGGGRLRMFVGAGAAERLTQSLEEHAAWTPPSSCIFNPLRPRAGLDLQRRVEAVVAARAEKRRQAKERIAAYYDGIDAAAWRKRFAEAAAGGPPLRVLGITTRYSTVLRYSMEELQTAVRQGGGGVKMQMEICMEPDDQSLENDFPGTIERLKPDLLVTISRLRHENPDLPRNMPALCWDQDNLPCMRDPAALADLKGLTFVAGPGAVFGAIQLNWPVEACIFCHAAGMTHRYAPGAASAEEEARFGGDVSYVSHASGLPETLRDSFRAKWTGGAKEHLALFDAAAEEAIAAGRGAQPSDHEELRALIQRRAEEARTPLTPAVEHALRVDLRLLVDRAFRHATLDWVARWCAVRGKRLRLWGNGWEKHPALARWAAGAAVPGAEAQAVYRASRINLQIIETGVLHSRLLDGWAAGGFFLIRQAHRAQDNGRIRELYRIGQLTAEEGIRTIGELAARGSGELRHLWDHIAGEHAARSREREFPEFQIWRRVAPPYVLFPGLERLMFNDAAGFAKLAEEFCDDANARRRVSEGIRERLVEHLSYDARWRDFLGHIAAHLGYGAAPAGDAAHD